jgi:PAS domain S-box-containing protein
VLTSTPTATAVISATQSGPTFAFVNPAFSALTGFDAEECVGAGHALLFGGDPGRAGMEGLTAAIDERRQWHAQLALLRKTGETIWVDASSAPIEGGGPTGGLSLLALTDVSALKAAADEDRETAEYLAGVVRSLPGFVFSRVLRADGAIDHIAPEWVIDPSSRKRAMTRFDPFERVHPDDHERCRAIDQSIATRRP